MKIMFNENNANELVYLVAIMASLLCMVCMYMLYYVKSNIKKIKAMIKNGEKSTKIYADIISTVLCVVLVISFYAYGLFLK